MKITVKQLRQFLNQYSDKAIVQISVLDWLYEDFKLEIVDSKPTIVLEDIVRLGLI